MKAKTNITLFSITLFILSCGGNLAQKNLQQHLDRLYPDQFEAFEFKSAWLEQNLNISSYYVGVRAKDNELFQSRILVKGETSIDEDKIKRKLAIAFWRLVHTKRLANELSKVLPTFSVYAMPRGAELENLPINLAFDNRWLKVMPKTNMALKLYLYTQVTEKNRASIDKQVQTIVRALQPLVGAKSKLELSFFSDQLIGSVGKVIYGHQYWQRIRKWQRQNALYYLYADLSNLQKNFWSKIRFSTTSSHGRQLMKKIVKGSQKEIRARGMYALKNRFAKLYVDPFNLNVLHFKVPTCKIAFERRCPKKQRHFLKGKYKLFESIMQFN